MNIENAKNTLHVLKRIKSAWNQRKLNQLKGFNSYVGLCTNTRKMTKYMYSISDISFVKLQPILSFKLSDSKCYPISHPTLQPNVAYYNLPLYDRRTLYGARRYEFLCALIQLYTNLVNMTEPQRLWVEALRSGKFEQTLSVLQDSDGFCCLGVACAVAKDHEIEVELFADGDIKGTSLQIQPKVKKWLGLNTSLGSFSDTELSTLNDSDKLTFDEIANYIEIYAHEFFIQS